MSTTTTAARYVLAHRRLFNEDWTSGAAYHVGDDSPEFSDFEEACVTADTLDETCGWDIIVVELERNNAPGRGSKPRIVYG